MPGYRTVLHGTCLLGGKHAAGDPYAKECPLRRAAARSERSRKAAASRWRTAAADAEHPDIRRGRTHA
jgi:hypothetical protein